MISNKKIRLLGTKVSPSIDEIGEYMGLDK